MPTDAVWNKMFAFLSYEALSSALSKGLVRKNCRRDTSLSAQSGDQSNELC